MTLTEKGRQLKTEEDLELDSKVKDHKRKQDFLDVFVKTINQITPFIIIFLVILSIFTLFRFMWEDWNSFLKLFLEIVKYIGGFII